ncbi:MAG TPA: 3-hydroxyacyl-CoA dehydrogenase NAD-binding domain-containing protein [Actinomycetes bacterium]|nr:3-hydroxyacyl-CoA dehydrogenase NAD-binding domain-containing protein [Actinomycetes bacterium]
MVGAGLMGHGIAQVFAEAGAPVKVWDRRCAGRCRTGCGRTCARSAGGDWPPTR